MAYSKRIAVVTGANKGIGLAIARNLALEYPKSPLQSGPLLIYVTARSEERGRQAVKDLASDPQLQKAKALASDGGSTTIDFHPLDISQTKSIQEFAAFLKKNHPDGIDIVINNAGIAMQGFNADVVNGTLETNYYGTLEANQDLLPLIRKGGRLVNVASMAGHLSKYSPETRDAFIKASETDVPAVTALMEKFKKAVDEGQEEKAGFPKAAYAVSKAGVIGFTKAVALEHKKKDNSILINACCPGYVKTDMTRGGGAKTPDEGAKTPVLLALGDIGGVSGQFWQHEKEIQWR